MYKIILYVIFFFCLVIGFGQLLSADKPPTVVAIRPATPTLPPKTVYSSSQARIKEKVKLILGKDMLAIVQCESRFRQFNSKGKPLISYTSDVGVMQINKIHWKRAKSLGLDIFYSENDNIIMGKIIYDESGPEAWVCHAKVET